MQLKKHLIILLCLQACVCKSNQKNLRITNVAKKMKKMKMKIKMKMKMKMKKKKKKMIRNSSF